MKLIENNGLKNNGIWAGLFQNRFIQKKSSDSHGFDSVIVQAGLYVVLDHDDFFEAVGNSFERADFQFLLFFRGHGERGLYVKAAASLVCNKVDLKLSAYFFSAAVLVIIFKKGKKH